MSELSMAVELLEQGRREDAVRELEKILAEDIDQISAWRLLASAVTNPVEIKECYEHVLRLDPRDAEAIEALRGLGPQETPADGLPFFQDDLAEMDEDWNQPVEPPVKPGIDTAPLHLVDQGMPAAPQDESDQPGEGQLSAEASLFDEEDGPAASPRSEKGGLLENDAFFYTMILIVIIAVLAVLFYAFKGTLLPFIRNLLPGLPI